MDLDDFTPAGGGSLRDQYGTREPVATFTPTRYTHPDEHWSPIGGELDPGRMTSPSPSISPVKFGSTTAQHDGEQNRASADVGDGFDLQTTARTIRSALRPGV